MSSKKSSLLHFFFAIIFFNSCAPSRLIRPLDKGQKVISANLGGPLFHYSGTIIPVPLTSIMYAQGLTDNTSVFGSIHTTSLLFGVAQTDIGICQKLYYNDSLHLGVSVNPALNIAQEFWPQFSGGFKCWPQVDINAYWEIHPKKSFVYAGIENWFELATQRADGQPQTIHWLFSPQIGYTYTRLKWNYNIELKYIAPNLNNLPNVVDYLGIGGKGALAVYFTVTRKLF
ncbi:MAG TPA: hypothetical protein VN922_08850 [Bacteroidia bacterium]|nr:hypothetical protein [Bacteroidia bacterium]